MATYVSKFNINDTAYIIDRNLLTLESVTITDIRIRESLSISSFATPYLVSYRGRTSGSQKEYNEPELYYLDEAKEQLEILLADKTSTIRNTV